MTEIASPFFENQQLNVSGLPQAEHIAFEQVSPEHKTVQFIWLTVFTIFVVIIGTGIIAVTGNILNLMIWGLFFGFTAAIIGIFSIFIVLGYKHRGFSIRQHDIAYKDGVLFRSQTIVPLVKLQHCEIGQGPFERMFNLSHLNLFTAGGVTTEISIRGLSIAKGEQLREFILDKLKNIDKQAHD